MATGRTESSNRLTLARLSNQGAPAAILAALAIAGIYFRAYGLLLDTPDFWGDEAWWTTKLLEQGPLQHTIRPIGYMLLSGALAHLQPLELFLRLPSFLAGIFTPIIIWMIARRLIEGRIIVIACVALVALNPYLIAFSKEYKPYSVEVFLYAALTLWCLHSWRTGYTSAAFRGTSMFATLLAYNLVFLWPGLLAAILCLQPAPGSPSMAERFQQLSRSTRLAIWTSSGSVIAIALFLAGRMFHSKGSTAFWGDKYGVFPHVEALSQWPVWYLNRTLDLIRFPMDMPGATVSLLPSFGWVFALLWIAGTVSMLLQRQWVLVLLLVAPMLCTLAANLVGIWPYGVFRTNLFLLPGLILTAGIGLDQLRHVRFTRHLCTVVAVLWIISVVPIDADKIRYKMAANWTRAPEHTRVLEHLEREVYVEGKAKEIVIADWHSWRPLHYYLNIEPGNRFDGLSTRVVLIRGPLNDATELLEMVMMEISQLVAQDTSARIWLVITKHESFDLLEHSLPTARISSSVHDFPTLDPNYFPRIYELQVMTHSE